MRYHRINKKRKMKKFKKYAVFKKKVSDVRGQ